MNVKAIILLFSMILVADALSSQEEWQMFKLSHGKLYNSIIEEKARYSIFQHNLNTIREHNEKFRTGESSYKLGITKFADMTIEEFKSMLSLKPRTSNNNEVFTLTSKNLPLSVNWTKYGAVTNVKDQGCCGSCWAFSAVGSLEGQLFLKNHSNDSLSAQNLVDCARGIYDNDGCSGGLMDNAFRYIEDNGIFKEQEYPYAGMDSKCKETGGEIKIRNYVDVANNENALQTAVATIGPISVAIDASCLHLYSSGIIFSNCGCGNNNFNLNHGVLLVGYGTEKNLDYWLIKNSWGSDWGEQGYFKLGNDGKNTCGITLASSYPVI